MFLPPHLTSKSKNVRSRSIWLMLNDKVTISEADITFYAEFNYFVPMTVQEGETQIKIAILFLEKLTPRRGIASAAYYQTKQLLSQY